MATFFLDYDGGNDAADGTTFANRWKTVTSGATAARVAPGDTIKIMGAPAPTSLGINATWTNKSPTVTLASALNSLIDNCDSAWTTDQGANNVVTADATIYRTSTKSSKHVIGAGGTTGLLAHFATGTLNLAAYQGITLWVQVGVKALAAGELSIHLCSDTAGVTTVDTLALPAITQTGQWVPVYIDKGSALGGSIASIALYCDTDNGAITVYLDNINATKAAGNDCLTLRSLIGKNTGGNEYWWAIRGINGTAITLDGAPSMTVSLAAYGYYGTTESVTTYKQETIRTDLVSTTTTNVQAMQDSGTAGNLITYSGGWDRTAMTTQNLVTIFDGQSGFGYGLNYNAKNFTSIDKVIMVRYNYGVYLEGNNATVGDLRTGHCQGTGVYFKTTTDLTGGDIHAWACVALAFLDTAGSQWDLNLMRGIGCAMAFVSIAWTTTLTGMIKITTLEISYCNWTAFTWASSSNIAQMHIGTLTTNDVTNHYGFAPGGCDGVVIDTLLAARCEYGALFNAFSGTMRIGSATLTDNSQYGFAFGPILVGADMTINSLTTSGNTGGGGLVSVMGGKVRVLKSSFSEATKVSFNSGAIGTGSISFRNYNGTSGDHRVYGIAGDSGTPYSIIQSETTTRHTASGIAWKISPSSTLYINANFPVVMPLCKLLCNTGTLVTVSVWMRRTNTGLTGILRCRGGQINGVAADVDDSIGAAADTWEEQTITFTPSEVGVVEIEVLCYGGTSYNLFVDDLTVSQA